MQLSMQVNPLAKAKSQPKFPSNKTIQGMLVLRKTRRDKY